MILLKWFIASIEINKINRFPVLTGPFPLIFLSNLFIASEAKLLINPGKLSLAKGMTKSVITFYLHYLIYYEETYLSELF